MPPRPESSKARRRPPRRRKKKSPPKAACYKWREHLVEAVSMPIESSPTTREYRAALIGVLLIMLLLPLLYVAATIGATYWLMRHYVVHAHLILEGVWPAICYFLPALLGPLIVYYLIKPIFASGSAMEKTLKLKRSDQPVLYEFVEQLAESVKAPPPFEIRVNNAVNASASFTSSNPFSRRLTLTIGLPLVYGLTVTQLSGVLGHELGHFAQRSGMRISFVVRRINAWFLGALYGPESTTLLWMQDAFSGRGLLPAAGRVVFYLSVSAARCVVWIPCMASNAVCCLLMRQMEFDADRVEAALVGAETFRTTGRRLTSLAVAEALANVDLSTFYEEGRLVDNFPRLVVQNVDHVTPRLKEAIKKHQREEETKWFDTHPSQKERIRNVGGIKEEPAIDINEKLKKARASLLFDSPDRVSRKLTREYYRSVLGRRLRESTLYPAEELLERKQAEIDARDSLRRYFQVQMPAYYPLPIGEDALQACESPRATVAKLMRCREEMVRQSAKYRRLLERYDQAEANLMISAAAMSLETVGLRFKRLPIVLESRQDYSAVELHEIVESALSKVSGEMLDYEDAASERLSSAMRLLAHPQVAEKFEDGVEFQQQSLDFVESTLDVAEFMEKLRDMRVLCHRLVALLSNISEQVSGRYMDRVFSMLEFLSQSLTDLYWDMGECDYPFDHADGDISLQEHVIPELPEDRDVSGMLMASHIATERLAIVQIRLFARLAAIAEKIERRMGLPPLDMPPELDESAPVKPKRSVARKSRRAR